jgi:eukaryotic-like serine/threonine-protein kinase
VSPSGSRDSLIARLLELPAGERDAFLERACAQNPELVAQIPGIRAALEERETRNTPGGPARGADVSIPCALGWALEAGPAEGAAILGTRIGPYKLLQKLGEGGFGVVWMADQEAPVRRRVALKIVKIGMDTKEVIARFEAERQALALMEHPNIARVFDAGTTEGGRPYFVMELVRGVPITRYCDENRLPTEERLRLFIAVCHAVQHAHQKGVIHRDLKPSNILVTLHDGVPVPKIIDFGIAKATGAPLTDKTLYTQFHAFLGTPVYTSPEQMEMSGLDVDTRSDIYSLGVLLYELLAGRTPFDADTLAKSGLDAMRRTIREVEPPRPSQRLRTLTGTDRDTVSRQRGTDAAKLSLLLRGDLDWIVMRCLEKDRTRRYETANGIAVDIERHFTDEPIAARPPGRFYRAGKFIRRHKIGVAAAAAVVVSLLAGLIASSILLARERTAHARAVVSERAEATLRREAESAREAETIRASRTARELGGELLAEGRSAEGLAWLVHAARKNPRDATIAPRLASALALRNFLLPAGPPLKFPSRVMDLHYVGAGRKIAVYCEDGTIGFIDTATGGHVRTVLPSRLAVPGVVFAGRLTVARGADEVVRILDPTSGRIEREFNFGQKILRISAKNPDEPVVFAVLEDLSMVVAEATTGRVRTIPCKHPLSSPAAISADGRWMMRADAPYREGELWDMLTGERRATRSFLGEPAAVEFSPDSTRIVAITLVPATGFTLRLWSVPDLAELTEPTSLPEIDPGSFPEPTFCADGRVFNIAWGRNQQMYETATGARIGPLLAAGFLSGSLPSEIERATTEVESPRPKQNGTIFFKADDRPLFITLGSGATARAELTIRNATTSEPVLPPLVHGVGVAAARMCEDGATLFTFGGDGFMRLWDVRTRRPLAEPGLQQKSTDFVVALAPDGRELVIGRADGTVQRQQVGRGAARPLELPRSPPFLPAPFLPEAPARLLWLTSDRAAVVDVASGGPGAGGFAFPERIVGLMRGGRSFAIRPDLRFMIVQTVAGAWQAWELDLNSTGSGRAVPLEGAPLELGWGWVYLSPTSDLLAMISEEQVETIRLWNPVTGRPAGTPLTHVATMPWHYQGGASFSPDGRRFVAASTDGVVTMWDTATSRQIARWQPHRSAQNTTVCFSPDGTRIATRNGFGDAQLWVAATGEPASPVFSDGGHVSGAAFSRSGERLVTWSRDGIARVWDGHTGAAVSEPMVHSGAAIRAAAFSPDGRRVATAANDGTARIWDARTGQPVAEPMKHDSRVFNCAFSPDGRFVSTEASQPGGGPTFLLWSVPPDAGDTPAPEWLLQLATVCAAKSINDAGQCIDIPEVVAQIDDVRRQLAALPDDAPLVEWGRWLLDDRAERPIAPNFTITPAEANLLKARLRDTAAFDAARTSP